MASQVIVSKYISDEFSDTASGYVHSLFTTSLNIMLEGKLVNISSKPGFLSSFGINIPESTMNEIQNNVLVSNLVTIKRHEIRIYGHQRQNIISLLNCKLDNLTIPRGSAENIIKSKIIDRLAKIDFSNEIGMQMTPKTQKVIRYLSESPLIDLDVNEEAILHLIGRGLGLTPSGDDLLLGYTMVLMSVEKGVSWQKQLQALLEQRTTDISLAYFKALFDHQASNYFIKLLNSIHTLDVSGIDDGILQLMKYGSTSGYDTLFGIYLGCQWVKNNLEY